MSRFLLLMILTVSLHVLHAQNTEEALVDSTKQNAKELTLSVVPLFSSNQFIGQMASFVGIGTSLIINNQFEVRLFVATNIDQFTNELIFPSKHQYDQSKIGVDLSWVILNKRLSPTAGAMISYSKSIWKPDEPAGEAFSDYIWQATPFVGGRWKISRALQAQLRCGYNFAGSADLIGLEESDYRGFYFEAMLNIRIADL